MAKGAYRHATGPETLRVVRSLTDSVTRPVRLPTHSKANNGRDRLHAMQFRAAPPPQVSSVRPAQPTSPSDRD